MWCVKAGVSYEDKHCLSSQYDVLNWSEVVWNEIALQLAHHNLSDKSQIVGNQKYQETCNKLVVWTPLDFDQRNCEEDNKYSCQNVLWIEERQKQIHFI